MPDSISNFIFLLVGFTFGALALWLAMRGKIALSRAQGQATGEVERTSLAEQQKAALQEVTNLTARLTELDAHTKTIQGELDVKNRESAQLSERAKRLNEVEELNREMVKTLERLNNELADSRVLNGRLHSDVGAKQKRLGELEHEVQRLSDGSASLLKERSDLLSKIASLSQALESEQTQTKDKLALLNEAREQLSNQFKALASEILDEKSKKFTDQNQTNIKQLLDPLKQQISEFKSKVEEVYVSEGKDRSALSEQVKQLIQLNNSLSKDAQNLTLAIKGDSKAQGNWGEILLDDVLEKAGLRAGQHYDRQETVKSEDGQTHVIPDVVLHLPGDRHLVIDSKMTLPDYRAFANALEAADKQIALKRHLVSIRAHIKGLSEKNYQSLYGLKSLDFVVMFIPLEPAFMLAVTNDNELFQQAWDKNVLLVSPSTLLFVVRTVAHLWRQEELSRNAKDISNRGADLYDKLVGFVNDLQAIGTRLQQAQSSFDEAKKKLVDGKGNVIGQAEKLRELGVKPSKSMPPQWVAAEDTPAIIVSDIERPEGEQNRR